MTGNSGLYKNTVGAKIEAGEMTMDDYLKGLPMTANEYQEKASRFMRKDLSKGEQMMHALHGLCAEVGEVHSLYQKIYQGHIFDREHEMKEIGDVLWMIAELCTVSGYKLEDIMQMNIDKLNARYPEGFEVEKSLNRKEGDI